MSDKDINGMKPLNWKQVNVSNILANSKIGNDNLLLLDLIKLSLSDLTNTIRTEAKDDRVSNIVDMLMMRIRCSLASVDTSEYSENLVSLSEKLENINELIEYSKKENDQLDIDDFSTIKDYLLDAMSVLQSIDAPSSKKENTNNLSEEKLELLQTSLSLSTGKNEDELIAATELSNDNENENSLKSNLNTSSNENLNLQNENKNIENIKLSNISSLTVTFSKTNTVTIANSQVEKVNSIVNFGFSFEDKTKKKNRKKKSKLNTDIFKDLISSHQSQIKKVYKSSPIIIDKILLPFVRRIHNVASKSFFLYPGVKKIKKTKFIRVKDPNVIFVYPNPGKIHFYVALKKYVKPILKKLKIVYKHFHKSFFLKIMDWMLEKILGKLKDKIIGKLKKKLLDMFAKDLKPLLKLSNALKAVFKIIGKAIKVLKKFVTKLIKKVFKLFKKIITKVLKGIIKVFKATLKGTIKLIKMVFKGIWLLFKNILRVLWTILRFIGKFLAKLVGKLWNKIKSMIPEKLKKFFKKIIDKLKAIKDKILKAANKIKEFFKNLKNKIAKALEKAKNALKKVAKAIKNAIKKIAKKIKTIIAKVFKAIKQVIKKIIKKIVTTIVKFSKKIIAKVLKKMGINLAKKIAAKKTKKLGIKFIAKWFAKFIVKVLAKLGAKILASAAVNAIPILGQIISVCMMLYSIVDLILTLHEIFALFKENPQLYDILKLKIAEWASKAFSFIKDLVEWGKKLFLNIANFFKNIGHAIGDALFKSNQVYNATKKRCTIELMRTVKNIFDENSKMPVYDRLKYFKANLALNEGVIHTQQWNVRDLTAKIDKEEDSWWRDTDLLDIWFRRRHGYFLELVKAYAYSGYYMFNGFYTADELYGRDDRLNEIRKDIDLKIKKEEFKLKMNELSKLLINFDELAAFLDSLRKLTEERLKIVKELRQGLPAFAKKVKDKAMEIAIMLESDDGKDDDNDEFEGIDNEEESEDCLIVA